MINFFRKIRRKLADQNQFVNYSKYAIGEIVLVMVGILLALQVNNWNEERKNKDYESVILNELVSSLENDLKLFDFLYERMERKRNAMNNFLNLINKEQSYIDSILVKNYSDLKLGIEMTYDKGAYESLKSKGIELITDEKLRKHIIELYEVTYPRIEEFIDGYYKLNYERSRELSSRFEDLEILKVTDTTWNIDVKLNYKNLMSNVDFQLYMKLEMDEYKNNIARVEWAKRVASRELEHLKEVVGVDKNH